MSPRAPLEYKARSNIIVSITRTLWGSPEQTKGNWFNYHADEHMRYNHSLIFISSKRVRSPCMLCPTTTRVLDDVSDSGLAKLL